MGAEGGAGPPRTGGGQHDRGNQQGSDCQQEEILELEASLMQPGRIGEVAGGGKQDRWRLPAGDQVENDRDRRQREAGQGPRERECHRQATCVERTSAWRRARPNGVSVVTRSYAIPWRRHDIRQSSTTFSTVRA